MRRRADSAARSGGLIVLRTTLIALLGVAWEVSDAAQKLTG